MPVYLVWKDADDRVQELDVSNGIEEMDRAAADRAHLAWPAAAAAANAELEQLACALANADVTVEREGQHLVLPDLAYGPGDTAGIRVCATRRAPHALYVVTAADLVPFTAAASALAYLQPLIEASGRGCEGCSTEPGAPCLPNCLPDPSAD
ncbi:hypothetical protein AB0H07_38880 [Streptomyces sp. NPDC021354]|uniref:hypothetical protein n=1 Tax=Streptomyces sp. NPDC021354 TaxID=3154793 RepID=UPI0033F326E8